MAGKPVAQFQHFNLYHGQFAQDKGFVQRRPYLVASDFLLKSVRIAATSYFTVFIQQGFDALGHIPDSFSPDISHFSPILFWNGKDIAKILALCVFQGSDCPCAPTNGFHRSFFEEFPLRFSDGRAQDVGIR